MSEPAFKPDAIVGRILGSAPDPVGGLVCFGGFVGESPQSGHIRLFTTLDFSVCLDIPESEIVGQEKIEKPGLPGGSFIWVKRGTVLSLTMIDAYDGHRTFLQGPLLHSDAAVKMMSAQGLNVTPSIFTSIWSVSIATVLTSIATFSFAVCTRVTCPDPSDGCPDPPEPLPPNTTIIFNIG